MAIPMLLCLPMWSRPSISICRSDFPCRYNTPPHIVRCRCSTLSTSIVSDLSATLTKALLQQSQMIPCSCMPPCVSVFRAMSFLPDKSGYFPYGPCSRTCSPCKDCIPHILPSYLQGTLFPSRTVLRLSILRRPHSLRHHSISIQVVQVQADP